MVLFIDAAAREDSRTRRLAEHLLSRFTDNVETVKLYDTALPLLDDSRLAWRTACCNAGAFIHPYFDFARQFAAADTIVIAAPYWDLSFPAILKRYLETICVTGLTFRYSPEGSPIGLCRAKALFYVTTAGGPILPDFGFGYVRALSRQLFGISDCRLISAENLDIVGNDPEAILKDSFCVIDAQTI